MSYGQNSIKLEEAAIHLIDRLHALLSAEFFINVLRLPAMHEELNHLVLELLTSFYHGKYMKRHLKQFRQKF